MKRLLILLCFLLFLTPQVGATTATVLGTAGSGASFSPDSITGLVLWLKADAITGLNDGDAVTTWTDSSTAGNNATQGTADNKPSYQTNELNGKPVVRFDGATDFLTIPDLTHSTIFVVHKLTKSVGGSTLFTVGGAYTYIADSGSASADFNSAVFTNWYKNGVALSWVQGVTLRGEVYTALYNSWTILGINGSSGSLALAYSDWGVYWGGDIAEIIVYSSALSDPNRIKVEDFLSAKYGIAVTH